MRLSYRDVRCLRRPRASAPWHSPARAAIVNTDFRNLPPYGNGTLPAGVRARLIPNINGLTVNILEAGFETPGRPLVLLLHGFPNLEHVPAELNQRDSQELLDRRVYRY